MMVSRNIHSKKDSKIEKILILVSCFVACAAARNLNPIEIGFRSAITSHSRGFVRARRSQEQTKQSSFYLDFEDSECSSDYFQPKERKDSRRDSKDDDDDALMVINSSLKTIPQSKGKDTKPSRGGAGAVVPSLTFYENMICGAVSRSIAQVCTHPANT
jgi:hypothetical protein